MRTFACVVAALLISIPASAAPFTWVIAGTIDRIGPPLPDTPNEFTVGDSFTWTLTMESTSPNLTTEPGCGFYKPITSMSFQSGGINVSRSATVGQAIGQDYLTVCYPLAGEIRIRSDFGASLSLQANLFMRSTGELPIIPTGNNGTLAVCDRFCGPFALIASGPVQSVTLREVQSETVPEPGMLLLFGMGATALRRVGRRSRS